jgi:hypothetical protein
MNKEIDLVDLLEKNIEIERVFNQRLDKFNKDLDLKEQEIRRLEELIAKEKKQYIANRLFNKGTLQRNQELNQAFKILKQRIKKVYQKLDQNNDRLNNIIKFIENNKQVGGGEEQQLMEYLDKIESELKKNINRINYVENELKGFISGKDVELQKVSQILDQVLETPNKNNQQRDKNFDQVLETPNNNNQQTDKNFDQEAEKILNDIEKTENQILL